MSHGEPGPRGTRPDAAGAVGPSATVQDRAAGILERLERILPFDAGWLALRDPERHRHVPLATTGPAEPLVAYFGRPEADDEVELLGLNGRRPPVLAGDLPIPLPEVRAWADHLLPAGFRQGLAAGLFTTDGRHVGFLSLLSGDREQPSRADLWVVGAITTVIADALDRTRDVAETAAVVERASAGVVLTRAGDVLALPGLPGDRLLAPGSAVLETAADELAAGGTRLSFLASVPDPGGAPLVRVVALDVERPDLDHLSAAVLLTSPGDVRGLSTLDLRVLGLLVEGVTDVPALARSLHVSPNTAAGALERALAALGTRDLTAAAVRALRGGWRIPSRLSGAG
jgi:hypothetical protein